MVWKRKEGTYDAKYMFCTCKMCIRPQRGDLYNLDTKKVITVVKWTKNIKIVSTINNFYWFSYMKCPFRVKLKCKIKGVKG